MITKLTVLGCGGSLGVPNVMGRHGECDMNNPKNFRTRTSAWIAHNGKNFLIDTSPDLRTQLLRENLSGTPLDAVLYTHTHADHCHGIDDLRPYYWNNQTLVNIYGHAEHMAELQKRFEYQFIGSGNFELYKPILKANIVAGGPNIIADTEIQVIEMVHGDTPSMGYRIGDIAWCTDFKMISDAGMKALGRSEERREGKEGKSRGSLNDYKTRPQRLTLASPVGQYPRRKLDQAPPLNVA
ncbi:MAG TPA: hypothetical protein DIS76_06415, partial [Rhodospirillaceae bacterium]|nr:hypothetical protein [Rhodospirillaceae bacterium]